MFACGRGEEIYGMLEGYSEYLRPSMVSSSLRLDADSWPI